MHKISEYLPSNETFTIYMLKWVLVFIVVFSVCFEIAYGLVAYCHSVQFYHSRSRSAVPPALAVLLLLLAHQSLWCGGIGVVPGCQAQLAGFSTRIT